MGCACKGKTKARSGARYTVTLPGGTKVTKATESEATSFAAKHPGSKVAKAAA